MNSEVLRKWLEPKPRGRMLVGGSLLCLLCLFVILFSFFYVRAEHYFYSWDWALYQNIASAEAAAFRASPVWSVNSVMSSLSKDYNWLFSVPLLPVLLVLGDSRTAFIVSLALIYLLPLALVLGAIATKLLPFAPRKVFWSTAILTLLTPTIWAPTLRGWPDVGAAFLIALAIWIHLEDKRLSRTARILLIGVLAVAAMMFRRQYAYDAVALYGALGLQALLLFAVGFKRSRAAAFHRLFSDIVYIGLAGVISLSTLALVGWPFLFHVLGHNYLSLYASFAEPLRVVFASYVSDYGIAMWALAILGFLAGLWKGVLVSSPASLVLFFGGISFVEWFIIVKQVGPHFTPHFAAFIVLGVACLGWVIWTQSRRWARTLGFSALVLFVILNFVNGLAPIQLITNESLQALFAARYPPLEQKDYDSIAQLIAYLRQTTNSESTYVVSSNMVLNPDLMNNAERILYGRKEMSLHLLKTPEVDSRDYYPLEPLLKSDYVVLVTPFQGNDTQKVVESVYDAFTQNWAISEDFVRLPTSITLEKGIVASVYRRIHTTQAETAMRTLLRIQNVVGQTPGGQAGWMILGQLPQSSVAWEAPHTYEIHTILFGTGDSSRTSFVYSETLPVQSSVSGKVAFADDRCSGAALHFAVVNRQGRVTDVADIVRHPGDTPEFSTSSFSSGGAVDLVLNVTRADSDNTKDICALHIDHLKISGK